MNTLLDTNTQYVAAQAFDLVRISQAKKAFDITPNQIRDWVKEEGLPIYKKGGAVFVSRNELDAFIRSGIPTKEAA